MTDSHDEILDMAVIAGLRALEEDGAPGLFQELVDLFLSDTPPRMQELRTAAESGDLRSVEETAHSLKSSCGNLGAKVLVDLFREIERLGREQSPDEISGLVAASDREFERVREALMETR